MPRPTLDQSFSEGRPVRSAAQHHSWLTAQERRFILWGLKERWPAVRIVSEMVEDALDHHLPAGDGASES